MEIWKAINNYEGYYEVSSLGRVKRVEGYVNTAIKHNTKVRKAEKILKPHLKKNGYMTVDLCKNNEVKTILVHRLVAEAFCENLEGKKCVNHINAIRSDNRAANLEWVSHKENADYAVALGNIVGQNKHPVKCRQLGKTFDSSYQAAQYINQTYFQNSKQIKGMASKIRAAASGMQKSAYGFTWEHYSEGSSTISQESKG